MLPEIITIAVLTLAALYQIDRRAKRLEQERSEYYRWREQHCLWLSENSFKSSQVRADRSLDILSSCVDRLATPESVRSAMETARSQSYATAEINRSKVQKNIVEQAMQRAQNGELSSMPPGVPHQDYSRGTSVPMPPKRKVDDP